MPGGAVVIHRASYYTGLHLQGFFYRASLKGLHPLLVCCALSGLGVWGGE